MSKSELAVEGEPGDRRLQEIQASLRRLERRDWSLWCTAVLVMVLLTVAVASLAYQLLTKESDPFSQFHLSQSVRGLTALVLLFCTYVIYQQILIKRLRGQLAEQIRMAAKFEVRAEEFEKLAIIDPLTALYNRRFAEQRLAAELARSRRKGYPLIVVALDLDDLKQINDRYGHPGGDLALQKFAEGLKGLRVSDLAARMGGDEFLMILPECRPEQLEHLLTRLADLEVEISGQRIPLRFAAGWADYQPGEEPAQLLERADQALYADKNARKRGNHPTKFLT